MIVASRSLRPMFPVPYSTRSAFQGTVSTCSADVPVRFPDRNCADPHCQRCNACHSTATGAPLQPQIAGPCQELYTGARPTECPPDGKGLLAYGHRVSQGRTLPVCVGHVAASDSLHKVCPSLLPLHRNVVLLRFISPILCQGELVQYHRIGPIWPQLSETVFRHRF